MKVAYTLTLPVKSFLTLRFLVFENRTIKIIYKLIQNINKYSTFIKYYILYNVTSGVGPSAVGMERGRWS